MIASESPPHGPSSLLAYAQLVRVPNLSTAVADVAMGFLFVRAVTGGGDTVLLVVLAAGSMAMYAAGTVLNDLFDIEIDARERPARPIPSGRVSPAAARRLGMGLLAVGLMLGLVASLVTATVWPLVVAAALAACVILYDGLLKRTPAGPVVMGGCRMLNVLWGMSVAGAPPAAGWAVAGGIGIYVAGVTLLARQEAGRSHRGLLLAGTAVLLAGIALLASLPTWTDRLATVAREEPWRWWVLPAVVALVVGKRCLAAVADPAPHRVQAAVKQGILSLVVLDAAVVLAVRGPVPALGVLALLLPAVLLARRVPMT